VPLVRVADLHIAGKPSPEICRRRRPPLQVVRRRLRRWVAGDALVSFVESRSISWWSSRIQSGPPTRFGLAPASPPPCVTTSRSPPAERRRLPLTCVLDRRIKIQGPRLDPIQVNRVKQRSTRAAPLFLQETPWPFRFLQPGPFTVELFLQIGPSFFVLVQKL
jgi:hypothetical protein